MLHRLRLLIPVIGVFALCALPLAWTTSCSEEQKTPPPDSTAKPVANDTMSLTRQVPLDGGDSVLIAPVQAHNGKWGFINQRGQWLVLPIYDEADIFVEGLAPVAVNTSATSKDCFYLNVKGEVVYSFPGAFFASQFQGGHAAIGFADSETRTFWFRFIDRQGKFVEEIPKLTSNYYWRDRPFPWVDPQTNKVGFINEHGKVVIPARFERVEATFNNGVCPVVEGGKFGYINKQGKYIVPPQLSVANNFFEGYGVFQDGNTGKWGIVDSNGVVKMVEEPGVELYNFVYGGQLGAKKNGLWGYLDTQLRWVIEPRFPKLDMPNMFNAIGEFDLRPIPMTNEKNPLHGFIDKKGNQVLPPVFSDARPFKHGLAMASTTFAPVHRVGFIDRTGKFVIPELFLDAKDFSKVKK